MYLVFVGCEGYVFGGGGMGGGVVVCFGDDFVVYEWFW